MIVLVMGGAAGLLLGIGLGVSGLTCPQRIRRMLTLRDRDGWRVLLWMLGIGAAMTALLCYLAVIDVDTVVVRPLNGGTLAGGALFGAALGVIGRTPITAVAGVGCGRFRESLCTVAGCVAGVLLLPRLAPLLRPIASLLPGHAETLFRMTLTFPFRLDGGFAGQACIGLLLMAAAIALRPDREEITIVPTERVIPPDTEDSPTEADASPSSEPEEGKLVPNEIDPADLPDQPADEAAFVAALPEEEPVVVDTAAEPMLLEVTPDAAETEALPADEASADEEAAEAAEAPDEPAEEPAPPPEKALPQVAPFQQISLPVPAQVAPERPHKKKKSSKRR